MRRRGLGPGVSTLGLGKTSGRPVLFTPSLPVVREPLLGKGRSFPTLPASSTKRPIFYKVRFSAQNCLATRIRPTSFPPAARGTISKTRSSNG